MKKVGNRRYVHRSALHQLSEADQRRVHALEARVAPFAWSVARVDPADVMIGKTTSFSTNDHPELIASATWRRVGKSGGQLVEKTYVGDARPIYHRCEQFLDLDHPRCLYFTRLSAREEAAGLLSRPDVGTRGSWERAKHGAR